MTRLPGAGASRRSAPSKGGGGRAPAPETGGHALTAAGVLAASGLGLALLVHATRISIGLAPDSAVYLGAATSLAHGHGYGLASGLPGGGFEPVTHFPPLYPALLAALAGPDGDPVEVARAVNRVLLAANALLAGWLVLAASGSRGLPILAAAAVATAPGLLWVHGVALSEPLFLWLVFASLGLLAAYLDGARPGLLVAAAGLASLASLTRYAGMALLLAGSWVLLRSHGRRSRRRVAEAVAFAGIGALPLAAWMLRNLWLTGAPTDRRFAIHPVGGEELRELATTLRSWLLVDLHVGFAVAVGLAGGLLLLARGLRRAGGEARALPRVLRVFAVCYLGLLGVSISFFDAGTPLNSRILSPLFVVAWILALLAAQRALQGRPGRALGVASVLLALALLAGYAARSFEWADQRASAGGVLYGGVAWRESATLEVVREIPDHVALYSNGVDAIRLLAGRGALWLPRRVSPGTQQPANDLPERLAELREALRSGETVIVWFETIRWRPYLVAPDAFQRVLPVRRIQHLADGSIWIYDRSRDVPDAR